MQFALEAAVAFLDVVKLHMFLLITQVGLWLSVGPMPEWSPYETLLRKSEGSPSIVVEKL
jgi:hypothetical protein